MRKKVIILVVIGIILLITGIIMYESNNKQLSYIKYNVGSINDDMVAITDNKKIGYLNINTNKYELKYEKNSSIPFEKYIYSNNYAPYNKKDKIGLIDKNGKVVLKAKYTDVIILNNNKVITYNENKYSIIDINTKKTIIDNIDDIEIIKNINYLKLTKEEQTSLYNFKDNSSMQNINIKLTLTSEDSKEYIYLIEKDGIEKTYYLSNKNNLQEVNIQPKELIKLSNNQIVYLTQDNKFSIYNLKNKKIITFNNSYSAITEVSNNLVLAISLENKYGYINESEETIIPFSYYEGTEEFNDKGYAIVNSNNKYGVINKKNKIIIPFEYDYLEQVKDNLYISMKNNKYNLINLKNNKVGNTYNKIISTDKDLLIIEDTNNKYGIINLQGKEIIKPDYDDIKFDNNYFIMNSKKDGTLIRKISG